MTTDKPSDHSQVSPMILVSFFIAKRSSWKSHNALNCPVFIFSQSEVARLSFLDFHDLNTIEDYRPDTWEHILQLVYDISGSSTTGRITSK